MRKLAIVGTHPDTRELAPFDDARFEIWVFNEAPQQAWCRRWGAVFQMHRPEVYKSPENFVNPGHWDWLKASRGKKIYMQEIDPEVPDSVRYPIEAIQDCYLAGLNPNYMKSTIDLAIALALYQGFDQIHIYGVELWSNTEYSYQAESYRYWIGFARGLGLNMGMNLVLHSSADLFAGKLYGYHSNPVIEREYYEKRALELEPLWKKADRALFEARRKLDKILEGKVKPDISAENNECRAAALEAGELAGALGEAEGYARRLDVIPRQEFERRCAKAQRAGEEQRVLMYHNTGILEYVWNAWTSSGKIEALNQVREFVKREMQCAYDTGAKLGIHHENWKYMLEIDSRIMAGGHVKKGGKTAEGSDEYQFKPQEAIVR